MYTLKNQTIFIPFQNLPLLGGVHIADCLIRNK